MKAQPEKPFRNVYPWLSGAVVLEAPIDYTQIIDGLGFFTTVRGAEQLNKWLLILVCKDMDEVGIVSKRLEQVLIPERASVVIGYLDPDNEFIAVLTFP